MTTRKSNTETKSDDQKAAEERAAALGNTPVAERGTDATQHVYDFDAEPEPADNGG